MEVYHLNASSWARPEGEPVWPMLIGQFTSLDRSPKSFVPPFHTLHVMIGGAATLVTPHGEYKLDGNSVFCSYPNYEWSFLESEPIQLYFVKLVGPHLNQLLKDLGVHLKSPVIQSVNTLAIHPLLKRLKDLQRDDEGRDPYLCRSIFYEVCYHIRHHRIHKDRDRNSELFDDALNLVNCLIDTTSLDVNRLASELGVSTSTIQRMFKKNLNMTPNQYIQKEKVKLIKDYLIQDKKLNFIASACGFSSENYLITFFKQHIGVTPDLWRRNQQMHCVS